MALPALVIVLAAALWAVTVVGAHLECVDAARAGARAAARGEGIDAVRAVVVGAAPAGAQVKVAPEPGTTRVEVFAYVRPLWQSTLPKFRVSATAVSATEPGVVIGSAEPPEPPSPPPPFGGVTRGRRRMAVGARPGRRRAIGEHR